MMRGSLICWLKYMPFKLETDVLGLLHDGSLMASCDQKSVYDNVLLHPDSQ